MEVGEIRVGGRASREGTEGDPGDGGFERRPDPLRGVLWLTRKGSSRSLRGGRLPPYSAMYLL